MLYSDIKNQQNSNFLRLALKDLMYFCEIINNTKNTIKLEYDPKKNPLLLVWQRSL
jgi:hypothetical protein